MSAALEKRVEWQRTLINLRVDYMQRWPRVTFTALAEEHGVSRQTIARVAKRERWQYHARVINAEKGLRKAEETLAFARRQAREIAAAVGRFAGDKKLRLDRLAAEAKEASMGVSYAWTAAHHYAEAREALVDAKADRPRRREHALRDLTRSEHNAPGKWPMYGYGPRKPFSWEKRRAGAKA